MDYLGKRLLHTPEGVRDIYGEEYAKKLTVHELFHEKLNAFEYPDIQMHSTFHEKAHVLLTFS